MAHQQYPLDNNFMYHPPKEGQQAMYEELREEAKKLAARYLDLCPPSRELSVALTELETSVMWANAAIARNMA